MFGCSSKYHGNAPLLLQSMYQTKYISIVTQAFKNQIGSQVLFMVCTFSIHVRVWELKRCPRTTNMGWINLHHFWELKEIVQQQHICLIDMLQHILVGAFVCKRQRHTGSRCFLWHGNMTIHLCRQNTIESVDAWSNQENKLASLKATLVWNSAHWVTEWTSDWCRVQSY